jgi:hypothetical protein
MVLAMKWEAEREREAQRKIERALLEKERVALLASEISSEVSEHIYIYIYIYIIYIYIYIYV